MEVTLKKNGWHRRLQEYVFSDPPRFNNLCPYFWLTNFCILVVFIIPVVPLWRGLRGMVRAIDKGVDYLTNLVDEKVKQPAITKRITGMTEEEILKAWSLDSYGYNNNEEYFRWDNVKYNWFEGKSSPHLWSSKRKECAQAAFRQWRNAHDNWRELINKYYEEREERFKKLTEERKERKRLQEIQKQEAADKAEESRKRRIQMFSNIVKYTKWLGYLVLGFLAVVGYYGLYTFGLLVGDAFRYMIAHFHYGNFIAIMKILGLIVSVILSILTLVWIFRIFLYSCVVYAMASKFFRVLFTPLIWIGKKVLVPIYMRIGDFIEFFWDYAVATKKNYCPGINWKEEKD